MGEDRVAGDGPAPASRSPLGQARTRPTVTDQAAAQPQAVMGPAGARQRAVARQRAGAQQRGDARQPAVDSAPEDPPERLRSALAGVRAVLLDMDGVVVLRGRPIPGAGDAVAALRDRGLPFRFLTNSSLWSREGLSARLSEAGIAVAPGEIVTALSASASLTARRWPGRPLYVLAAPDALREFDGQHLVSDEEADALAAAQAAGRMPVAGAVGPAAGGTAVAAVVVGDAGRGFTYERLNTAFRLVRGGARLVAVHRNRWWLTPDGATIDSGAFVRALEYAAGRRSFLVGKPSPAFFRAALATFVAGGVPATVATPPAGDDGSGPASADDGRRASGPDPAAVLMVGDDLQTDIAAAHRVGLRTAFVLSGKHGAAELEACRSRGRDDLPDAVAPSLSGIVAALD